MAKILLETEAASIGGGSGAVDKKCCTKSRAVALGCKVDSNYADNQLIPQGSASKAVSYCSCTINIKDYGVKNGARYRMTLNYTIGNETEEVTINNHGKSYLIFSANLPQGSKVRYTTLEIANGITTSIGTGSFTVPNESSSTIDL